MTNQKVRIKIKEFEPANYDIACLLDIFVTYINTRS